MKASELLVKLTDAVQEHGDLEIATFNVETEAHDATSEVEVVVKTEFDDAELGNQFFCIS